MSDIEILLRELVNKVEYLNQKIDRLDKKVDNLTNKIKTLGNFQYGTSIWGDDSIPLPLNERLEIRDPVPNPYEITCKGEN